MKRRLSVILSSVCLAAALLLTASACKSSKCNCPHFEAASGHNR